MQVPKLKMNTGNTMPQVALGLWKIRWPATCKKAVRFALNAGYRHFDTAQAYGNEKALGDALTESGIARKELFITTKIMNLNQKRGKVIQSFEKSLAKLQTDYVDLLLLHFPVTETRRAAWPKMEEIYQSGRAKAIGVSNYTIRHLEELLSECKVTPAVNQVELHVFLQQPDLLAYCKKQGILVEAYSPLAHGQGIDDPVLQKIATKHNKTPAQIMLRWCVEVGTVPLPKSTHKERIEQNFEIFDFSLDADDMREIKGLERNLRTCWDPTDTP